MTKLEGKYILPLSTTDIVATIDVADGAQTLLKTELDFERTIDLVLVDADSSISAGTLTIVGANQAGDAVTEVYTIPTTGSATVSGTELFKTITSATVASIAGNAAGDTISLGSGATVQVMQQVGELGAIIVTETAAGSITITDQDENSNRGTIGILKSSIVENDYHFDCSVSKGIRIVFGAASKISVTYARSTSN